MGADPSREEHVNKTNFYIYKVQKVEAPIDLDSSDEEKTKTTEKVSTCNSVENLHLENRIEKSQNIAANIENRRNDQQAVEASAANIKYNKEPQNDSDETGCLENEEHLEDLTQKIDEHLTASERSKLDAVDLNSRQNQIERQIPVTSERKIQIKKESIDTSIEKLFSLRNKFSPKIQQQNPEKSSSNDEILDGSSEINNIQNLQDLDKLISTNISAATTNAAPLPDDLQPEWISSSFVPATGSEIDLKDLVINSTCEKTLKEPESSNLLPEVSVPSSSNFTFGCSELPTQSLNPENEPSNLPPEPPIFTPGPLNFQPIPLHLTEVPFQKLPEEQIPSVKFSNLAKNPNYLPSSSHLQQPPITLTPGTTSGRKLSNLALRKKIQAIIPSSLTPSSTFPLNYSPISSTSNLSSSSDKYQSFSRSSSPQSTESSNSSTLDEQSKTLTPDQIKSKTKYLRHYGKKCTKLIDIPAETPKLNVTENSEDLLDEVEGPKDPIKVYWKQGVAVKIRGRKKKTDGSSSKSRNSNVEKSEGKIESSEPPSIESKSKKENTISSSRSPTKLKATARKTTNTVAIVSKRPFAVIDDKISKSEDSDVSNDYQSAKSGNSDSENQEKMTRNPKRQRMCSKLETEGNGSNDHAQNPKKSTIKDQKPVKTYEGPKNKSSIPTSSGSNKLEKFPDSDTENATKGEESRNLPKVASELGHGESTIKRKSFQRRESIIHQKRPKVQNHTSIAAQNSPKVQTNKVPQSPQKSSSLQSMTTAQPIGPSSRPPINQNSPNDNSSSPPSPTQNFHDRFPNLYLGLKKNDSKADSGSSSPTKPSGSPKSIPMKKRRQSVFEEQAQLIPENLTLNERSNAMRRWNQNTTKLIDIQPKDPRKRRRGRPKLNEDEKIKFLVERSKANEEKK